METLYSDLDEHRYIADNKRVERGIELLKFRQSRTALAAVLFLIDDGTMIPKLFEDFSSWKRPEIDLEFDHQGTFKKYVGQHFSTKEANLNSLTQVQLAKLN